MSTVHAASAPAGPRTNADARARPVTRRLGAYTEAAGQEREIVAAPGAQGSTVVIDRIAGTSSDARLLAHLCADEPDENARIVCSLYLADEGGRRCRPLTLGDFDRAPLEAEQSTSQPETSAAASELVDRCGRAYGLELTSSHGVVRTLRWHRRPSQDGEGVPITVRDAIGSLESYEPVRTLTSEAITAHCADPSVSVTVLRGELERVCASPVVLNRGLREAVLASLNDGRLSLSEIAIRCGRVKRNAKGRESGETSWLARRIGMLPPSGDHAPTPWVHSDVLGLIARCGLAVAPRDVELG
jgi:hypothetical protein